MTDAPQAQPQTEPQPVVLRVGAATDVGRVRSVNQDSMLVGPNVYVVADGMGGHAGGEVASGLTIDVMRDEISDPTPRVADLRTAVVRANELVSARSRADADVAGMGTTIVAAAVVAEDDEYRIALINVGDSRGYRLSGGVLDQVTDDHSLVGELVRDGQITRDDARTHPRRNIITRAVGIASTIQVDDFQILPRRGDRYLLCSDGLTDEVHDDDIARILRSIPDPTDAARTLVEMANAHGGRDNISVLILDVVDDGLPAAARGIVPSAHSTVPDDDDFWHDADEDTQSIDPIPAHEPDSDSEPDSDELPPKRRLVTVRSSLFVATLAVVVGVSLLLAWSYAREAYFVGIDDRGTQVTIYRGRPDGFLFFDPKPVVYTGIDIDDVPANVVDALTDGVAQPDRKRAESYVANLEDRIAQAATPTTTSTTTTP